MKWTALSKFDGNVDFSLTKKNYHSKKIHLDCENDGKRVLCAFNWFKRRMREAEKNWKNWGF